jgi:nucleotide-binding universal stress UspA family protein
VATKITVGVDGSESSVRALHWAADEARRRDAVLEVVTTWHTPVLATIPTFGVQPPADQLTEEARKGLLELLHGEGVTSESGVTVLERVVEGSAASVLIDASADADLLVIGSRGRGGFAGLLLGSVSHAVVSHARCPVVVVPPEDRDG